MRVRYYCHAGQETGYGRAATELALALLEAGVDVKVTPLNPALSLPLQGASQRLDPVLYMGPPGGWFHDVAIVHTMPLDCARVAAQLTGEPVKIAYTTWEGLDVPASLTEGLKAHFRQIWVPSRVTERALRCPEQGYRGSHPPMLYGFPIRILPHTFVPRETRPAAEEKRGYQFYWIGAWTIRKNPHGLIRSFCHTFTPEDNVSLVLHSPGTTPETFMAALAATGLPQKELPRIIVSGKACSDDALWRLHETSDCFVTATRGESWNLPAFEALQVKRHVIAPRHMGHDDFLFRLGNSSDFFRASPMEPPLTSADGYGYEANTQPAFLDVSVLGRQDDGAMGFLATGPQGMTARSVWLEPDLLSLSIGMRSAFLGEKRDLSVFYDVEEKFGHKAVAAQAIKFMQEEIDGD